MFIVLQIKAGTIRQAAGPYEKAKDAEDAAFNMVPEGLIIEARSAQQPKKGRD